MNAPTDPDLIKVTEIFLVPSSFLVAALGTADTNPHRAMVSLLGFGISLLWWLCSREALAEHLVNGVPTRRTRIMTGLPVIFAAGWMISAIAHAMLWNRPIGG